MKDGITVYFVRHGETDWNVERRYQGHTDIPLNENGRGQARRNGVALAGRLGEDAGLVAFEASPLLRARQTIEIVRNALGLPARDYGTDRRLMELNMGAWEGKTWEELPDIDPIGFASRLADPWRWVPPGGESYEMLYARTVPWLTALESDTVVVSHGGVMRCLQGCVEGRGPAEIPRLDVPQNRVLVLRRGKVSWL